jgi:outer membrane biogenesis lipoprotein LolB
MKALPTKMLPAFACLLMSLLLAACASQTPVEPTESPSPNTKYMYQTERNAQMRMATVVWVHPPKSCELVKSADDDN